METIIPRWEWRAFAASFGDADRRFSQLPPGRVQESDELYLLSPSTDANVKIRDELMDLKTLEHVNADGLEQWRPVMKGEFPLPAADVAKVCAALGVAPLSSREVYTLEQLQAELTHPSRGVRVVRVHKKRQRYTVGECLAEMTEVIADGQRTRTVAIELENPASVKAAVQEMGLGQFENVNYPRGLKRLLNWPAAARTARYAVIDTGTNSVKFHIGEKQADGTWKTIVDRADVSRLGESLDATGGEFTRDAMDRAVAAIEGMAAEARSEGAVTIAAVGTMGLRTARNSGDFIAEVERRTGVRIEVISGAEEARLAYVAVKSGLGLGAGSMVIFDTGGGSSQFTFGSGAAVTEQFSLNVGAVRFTEKFGLADIVAPADLQRALDAIGKDLSRLDAMDRPDVLVGMGGAVTNLTAVMIGRRTYDPEAVQGATLTAGEVDRQIELYRSYSTEERRQIVGLQPKRAEVILAGACIVRTAMRKLRKDELTVSDRGLRHGLLVERFGG
jgi:exopolyphosphatase/guanosine-5'-triphosphate,3'-diphosphate pyrophosphatase